MKCYMPLSPITKKIDSNDFVSKNFRAQEVYHLREISKGLNAPKHQAQFSVGVNQVGQLSKPFGKHLGTLIARGQIPEGAAFRNVLDRRSPAHWVDHPQADFGNILRGNTKPAILPRPFPPSLDTG